MAAGATLGDPASPLGKRGPSPGQWLEAVNLGGAAKGLDVACCFPTNSSSHSGRVEEWTPKCCVSQSKLL